MNDKDKKLLTDVTLAISLVENFCQDIFTFDQYQKDIKTKSAVERQLAIIGEAVNKLKQSNPSLLLPKAKEIINFRNRAIHAYDSIDDAIVWAIIKSHLPGLKVDTEELLHGAK